MILNIETQNVESTLALVQECFLNQNVMVRNVYEKTADFEIKPTPDAEPGEFVYGAASLLELAGEIPLSSIRIY